MDKSKDFWKFSGNKEELKESLKDYLEENDIDKFIKSISEYTFNNGAEYIQENSYFSETPPGMLSFMIAQKNYNINLKICTLVLLANIIDAKLKIPVCSFGMAVAGIQTKAITKLNEVSGEKCIAIEVMKSRQKLFNASTFNNNGECINNHLKLCKYKKSNSCCICRKNISKILTALAQKNVLKPTENGYKYIF